MTQVDVARLDQVLAGKRVDFLKLDVQGWELEVLRGMTGLFAPNPALRLFVEYWPNGLRRAGNEPAELLAFFKEHAWDLVSTPDMRAMDAVRFTAWDAKPNAFENLLATRSIR